MLTTLPLEAFVCRSVMTTYYFPDEPFNPNRHLIFTTSLVLSSMALALITCDLGMVFELIGATSAAALAYIFPPLCYIKLSSASRREKIPAYACVGFGLVVMGVSIVQAVFSAITSKSATAIHTARQISFHPILLAVVITNATAATLISSLLHPISFHLSLSLFSFYFFQDQ